ncbi:MAG: tRNA lysidine(34) synthetase TilS [Bacillota bacterium]|jgi:tRNA(Ile)-lysidine synthase
MKPSLNLNLLDKEKTYIVAVSFGPDSMALLHLLQQEHFKIEVAHVNYHLRKESDLEQSQLEQYCLQHDLSLHVLDVTSLPKGNLQDQARKIRYDFFKELASILNAEGVLTAHHQDDDLETAIMQSQRTMLYEYFGIRPLGSWEGIKVYRPLLSSTKQDLIDYCAEHQIPYTIDQSNTKLIYQRNRVRSQLNLLSPLEKNKKRLEFQKENSLRQNIIQSLQRWIPQNSISTLAYMKWDTLTQFLYWILLNQSRGIHTPITEAWLKRIDSMLRSQKPNIVIPYSKDWHIEKAYDKVWLIKDQDTKPYQLLIPQGTIKFSLLTIHLDRLKQLPETFILRSCKPNDVIKIKNYTKPFRRLAIDWKMPLFLRRIWPVFTNLKGDILLLPRYQKNHDSKANNWLEILE